jgi:hypothetical protein
MITIDEITVRLERGANYVVDTVAKEFPIVNLAKPMINRMLKNSTSKMTKYCNLLADENGLVDFNAMIEEMFNNAINSSVFTIPVGSLGDIEIGSGKIKFPIPLTQKVVSFGSEEIEQLRKILTSKYG